MIYIYICKLYIYKYIFVSSVHVHLYMHILQSIYICIYKYLSIYVSIYYLHTYLHIHMYLSHTWIYHILNIRLLHLRVKKIIVWYRRMIEKRKRNKLLIMFIRSRGAKIIQRQFRKYTECQKYAAVSIQRIIRGWLKRNFIEFLKIKVHTYFSLILDFVYLCVDDLSISICAMHEGQIILNIWTKIVEENLNFLKVYIIMFIYE
jgi:hypothetical protein